MFAGITAGVRGLLVGLAAAVDDITRIQSIQLQSIIIQKSSQFKWIDASN